MKNHFTRIAIVNWGEAAMRLIRAVRELKRERHLNISTVALFTEPDRQAMFVREADDALCIGPATLADQRKGSYQDITRVEQALKDARVDAAWVGWGPLSEDAWFADLCKRLGIVFIGPDAATLRNPGQQNQCQAAC